MQLRVGLDIDGVLANFNAPFIELIHKFSGVQLPKASSTYPNRWNYEEDAGMTKSRSNEMWEYIKQSEDFWETIPPYSYTNDVLLGFLDLESYEDVAVYFVTNRMGRKVKQQTEAWLVDNGYVAPTVIIARNKGLVAEALNLTHYIDDKPENCVDVVKHSPRTKIYMLAQPWNTNISNITTVHSVTSFLNTVRDDLNA